MIKHYTKTHEWVEQTDESWCLGISLFAQEQLGDVVAVELPEVGKTFLAGEVIAVIESVKAASDIYTPLTGEVIAVNETLANAPEKVNEVPEGDGWLLKLRCSTPPSLSDLMAESVYHLYIQEM